MPRYHIDLQENGHFYRDEDGRDFDDDAAARRGAVRRLIEVLEGLATEDSNTKLIVIVVRRRGEREPFATVSTRVTSLS